jgi:bifunctional DNA-binding transcriptional regulator/antitoxin component of YhaV-PrlF toxin-antitoxin module
MIRTIRHRFGDIPSEFLKIIEEIDGKRILIMRERPFKAKSLEELFEGLK